MMRLTLSIPFVLFLSCGTGTSESTPNPDAEGTTTGPDGSPSQSGTAANSAETGDSPANSDSTTAPATAVTQELVESTSAVDSTLGVTASAETSTGESGATLELPEGASLELSEGLAAAAGLGAAEFAARTAVNFETLSYDPAQAAGLDLIKASDIGLTEAELATYQQNGFVISTRSAFPHFGYGYASIYAQDLPLYISADSILFALHSSYDAILKSIEMGILVFDIRGMLEVMRVNLRTAEAPENAFSDVDVYLTVADSLISGEVRNARLPENQETVAALYASCIAAEGAQVVNLFGEEREVDFSQFKPRGHYTDTPDLGFYFRAMIWMGRLDLRLATSDQAGNIQLNRRQADTAVLLRSVMDDVAKQAHQRVDALVTAFVGEHDYMTAPQIDDLMRDLNVVSGAEFAAVSDQAVVDALVAGKYGVQRITSQIMVGGLGGTAPLPAAFALLGQRYVIDSHVFSNVVFDRVSRGDVKRMMPNPLDVAYAVLQNNQAGTLLQPELEQYDYASALASMRAVVDSEPRTFWELNLYNRWLDALRTLSPAQAMKTEAGQNLPQIARTEAWGRRLLNTQMASWAELRHDTILYTKQSYTSAATCEYPDAYVDPYPEFFGAIAALAQHALIVLDEQGYNIDPEPEVGAGAFPGPTQTALNNAGRVLRKFVDVGGILQEMALFQRTGEPHSEAHMAFVNQAVATASVGCGGPLGATGWYAELFIDPTLEWSPTIADVHTQPTTAEGAEVGRVLHVGTGEIRLMVTSVETCSGPRAYAGLVSSYYERIEESWNRLDDIGWTELLASEQQPLSPAWVTSLTAE